MTNIAEAETIAIRRIEAADLGRVARFGYTVSITEPMTDKGRLAEVFAQTGFWSAEAGAVAIVDKASGRFLGTAQFYRAVPCIHGFELGYILHEQSDRGKGLAAPAVRLLSDHLFSITPDLFRQQLLIETWNTPSWRLAERIGFTREGLLRSSGLGANDPGDSLIYSRTRKDWAEELSTKVGVS